MKRREFFKKASVGAAGSVVAASTLATPAIAQNKRTGVRNHAIIRAVEGCIVEAKVTDFTDMAVKIRC